MSAVAASLSVAQAFSPLWKRAQGWIARLSVIWTAWSVLSQFRSVQDVIAFVQAAARELNANIAWAVDLVVFVLQEAAAAFHAIADFLFGSLPILNWMPEQYHEPAIICFLALVPTLIAFARLGNLSSCFKRGDELGEEHTQAVSRMDVVRETVDLVPQLYDLNLDEALGQFWRNATSRAAQHGGDSEGIAGLVDLHRRAYRLARRFLSLVGFRVFSLRFYLSVLLAAALTYELLYVGLWATAHATIALALVWGFVVSAFAVGLAIHATARKAERIDGPLFAAHLARIHSVPVVPNPGAKEVLLLNPHTDGPVPRVVDHVLVEVNDIVMQWRKAPNAERALMAAREDPRKCAIFTLFLWTTHMPSQWPQYAMRLASPATTLSDEALAVLRGNL